MFAGSVLIVHFLGSNLEHLHLVDQIEDLILALALFISILQPTISAVCYRGPHTCFDSL